MVFVVVPLNDPACLEGSMRVEPGCIHASYKTRLCGVLIICFITERIIVDIHHQMVSVAIFFFQGHSKTRNGSQYSD